jgi:hypothetical protein
MNQLIRTLFLGLLLAVFPIGLHAVGTSPTSTPVEHSTAIESAAESDTDCSQIKSTASEAVESELLVAVADKQEATSYGCCRTCRTGKACGDTCISRYKTCHVGPGCACDAY